MRSGPIPFRHRPIEIHVVAECLRARNGGDGMLEDHLLPARPVQDDGEPVESLDPSRQLLAAVQKNRNPRLIPARPVEKIVL